MAIIRGVTDINGPKLIDSENSFIKSGNYKAGFYNLYTKDQINEILNSSYRLSEKMPTKGKELIINLPKVDGVYSLIVIRRSLVNSTYNKPLYLYEYIERID